MDYKTWREEQIRSRVYDTLSEIMFENEGTKEDMDKAIEWFQTHFYKGEEE